ncbi:LppU family putative lipoprotein [Nocardia sp. bgisy134]|uniref:LppU family putative lipoprotein n=1 Tax=unclassified Nocardia TaxID=2637762 RepID=UPI003D7334A6
MSRQRVRAGFALAAFMLVFALCTFLTIMVAFSMDGPEPTGSASPTVVETSRTTTTSATPMTSAQPDPAASEPIVEGMLSQASKAPTAIQMNVGDCVLVGDGGANAIEKTACGGGGSSYKVFDKVAADGKCPADADHAYGESVRGEQQGSLCMDIDWVVGGCMELGHGNPKHIDCGAGGAAKGVRVLEVKHGITDVNQCASGNYGFVYNQRRFVVCVAEL